LYLVCLWILFRQVINAAALPKMTVFGKVVRLNPRRNKENSHGYRVAPITIFGKAQKITAGPSAKDASRSREYLMPDEVD